MLATLWCSTFKGDVHLMHSTLCEKGIDFQQTKKQLSILNFQNGDPLCEIWNWTGGKKKGQRKCITTTLFDEQRKDEGSNRKEKIKFRKVILYLSYIITVSAVARFIPKPPALVDSKKQNLEEFLALNRSMRICLSAPPTFPSILSYCHF